MTDISHWLSTLTAKLNDTFGTRLLFVGLQGSYRRGEAHDNSDIDVVVILDTLSLEDLQRYRSLLAELPHRDRACGFVAGRQTLCDWPKHELFTLAQDTAPIYGDLEKLLPPLERSDILASVQIGASGLYHAGCHSYLHSENIIAALYPLYKSAFFILRTVYYLRSGVTVCNKRELLPLLSGPEQQILSISMDWEQHQQAISDQPDRYYDLLLTWCAQMMHCPLCESPSAS